MLSRSHRLPLRTIPEAFRTFRRIRGSSLQVLWNPRDFGLCRGAVIVPSHVVPLATDRNIVKRAIRQELYQVFLAWPMERQPIDIIVTAYSSKQEKIVQELHDILEKIQHDIEKE